MKRSSTDREILYEDNHLIIVNKLPSDIVQGDKTGDQPLCDIIKDYIAVKYNKPGAVFLGVVHRLDRPVSGAVIFARTSKALSRMNEMFREGLVKKTYWAVSGNAPPESEGTLKQYLVRNEKLNKSFVYDKPLTGGTYAELSYRLIASGMRYHLIEIELKTGRHHQIRAQLAAMGCIIKGDMKYGSARSNPGGMIHLHSRTISFIHPVKNELVMVEARPPEDNLWRYFLGTVNPSGGAA